MLPAGDGAQADGDDDVLAGVADTGQNENGDGYNTSPVRPEQSKQAIIRTGMPPEPALETLARSAQHCHAQSP